MPKKRKAKKTANGKSHNPKDYPEFARELPIPLNQDQLNKKSDQLVDAEKRLKATQDEKTAAVANWNKDLKDVRNEIQTLVSQLDTKMQLSTVKCFDAPNFAQNKVDTVRVDNGEVIDSRAMSAADRQQDFDQ